MNFERFEHLRGQNHYINACLDDCIQAERRVRVNPGDTAICARRAIENLFKDQSQIHGIKPADLAESIRSNCDLLEANSEQIREMADTIRKTGNRAVHPSLKKSALEKSARIDAATKKNIDLAMDVVKSLYSLLCLLHGNPGGQPFEEMQVPFDEYVIDRQLHDPEDSGRESFFVIRQARYATHYYLQCLSLQDELELENRREEASERFYLNSSGESHLRLPDWELSLPKNSDRKLIAYKVFPRSFLLSELKQPMTVKQALKLGLDLISALQEMKRLGMHHRNIYPGCVLVNQAFDGNYEAYLLNLQTCKINDSNVTVNALLAATYDRNLYVPAFLRGDKRPTADWEKVDVYALCRVVLFCMNRNLAYANNASILAQYPNLNISPSLRGFYDRLFRPDPKMRNVPTLEELKECFTHEYAQHP